MNPLHVEIARQEKLVMSSKMFGKCFGLWKMRIAYLSAEADLIDKPLKN